MCLHPQTINTVPEETLRIARAAFPKGNLYMHMRDVWGFFYTDEDFADLYSHRGQPAFSPWRLALVIVMQFVENLSDRQAADAVRARIDWKYALGLELDDPGFDFSILSEFRDRLIEGKAEALLLERMLELFREKKLLKARGQQRTDSTHVLAAIRVMNRLELVAETLRAALNDLAVLEPDWLRDFAPPEWSERYARRVEQTRLPSGAAARKAYAEQVGRDGQVLLRKIEEDKSELTTQRIIVTLKQTWERHYHQPESGEITWKADAELPRAATAIESPYDPEARHSSKREIVWTGYKIHLTETCDPELPRLITHVHTTVATTQDVSCTADIHAALKEKDLLPRRHYVDTGYVDAELLVKSQENYGVELFGPTRLNPSWQMREGGYDPSYFTVDRNKREATCPEGKVSVVWSESRMKPYDDLVIYARFARKDCIACPSRSKCVRSESGRPRTLGLHQQTHHEALTHARERMRTKDGQKAYQLRAGVEGSLSQGVRRSGLRFCRYRGRVKTHLQHLATAAGLNLVRSINYLSEVPLAPTRQSQFVRLAR